MTKPDMPSCNDQRFVVAGADILVLSGETMKAFCFVPRSRKEIAEHFGVKSYLAEGYINGYVRKGELKMTMPINPDSKQQRFVGRDVEIITLSEETLLEYCRTPRSKEEIYKYFGLTTKDSLKTYKNGKLKRIIHGA